MFESFKKNSKKNVLLEDKKPGNNLPGIRNCDQFPSEKIQNTGDSNIPPPPQQQQAQDAGGEKQILLKSHNFSKSEGKSEKKKNLKKEAKLKTSLKTKKKTKAEHSDVPTVKKPKSSSKQKEKPMKAPKKQKNKDNPVIIEFENETKNKDPSPVLTENTVTKGSFERKGFQRRSTAGDCPPKATSKGETSRLSGVLKVFKTEKERKEKKAKFSSSVTNKADLLMSGESVKDKYITNNLGPRPVEEEDGGDSDTDSPPLVHFGNIPTDVDLIGNIEIIWTLLSRFYRHYFAGMRIKNSTDSRKAELSNLHPDEEEEDGKFSGESTIH